MGFEIFDLKKAIREYNVSFEGETTPISINETFRVFTLSSEFTQGTLEKGFDAYKNSKFHHTGVTAFSKQIVTNLKQSVSEFASVIGTTSPGKSTRTVTELGEEVRSGLREHHENRQAQVQFQGRQDTVESLLSPELWKKFAKSAENNEVKRRQLEEIQATLEHHGRFCTHAHASLLMAYDVLLKLAPFFAQCRKDLFAAKKRRFFNRIPRSILKAWEDHLDQQEAVFKKERDDIVAHIQARLEIVAKDPLLKNADVLTRFVDILKSKGFLKETYSAPQIKGDELAEEQFVRFHEIVENHGNTKARKKLFELPWFGGRGSAEKSVKANLAERYGVGELAPTRRRFPEFLFYGTKLRLDWLENYSAQAKIDAGFQKIEEQKNSLTPFHERFLTLVFLDKEFQLNDVRIENNLADCKKGIRRFLAGNTVKFFEGIRQNFNEQRLKLVKEKIDVLTGIMREGSSLQRVKEFSPGFDPSLYLAEISADLASLESYFQKTPRIQDSVSKKIEDLRQYFEEQKTLVEKRIRFLKAKSEESHEQAEKERHEEVLLAPFYSEKGATPHQINLAFDYLDIAVNSVNPSKYVRYVNEVKEIYGTMKERFKNNLGREGDFEKLAQCAIFLNSYRELGTRKFLRDDPKRKSSIEFCKKGNSAKNTQEAIQYYDKANETDPNYLSAWRKKGELLWSLHKDVTSSDEELGDDETHSHLSQSVGYLNDSTECFEKPLSLSPGFLHPLVREAIADRASEYFCQWIGISEKGRLDATGLKALQEASEHAENVLMAIGGGELSERVNKMRVFRESNNFNALEESAKENLLFVIQSLPFTLQDPVEKDFLTLEQKLLKFLRKYVTDFTYDETQGDVLEDMLKEILAHRAFEYKDLEKIQKNRDYLELKPEVHFVLMVIAKLRFESNQIARVFDPLDKKSRVENVNVFFQHQQKKFFELKDFPKASKKKLTEVLQKHGSFRVSLEKIKKVNEAVQLARYKR